MSGRFTLSSRAEADTDEIAEYLATQSLELALRFYDAVWETFGRLGETPSIGRPREPSAPTLAGLRSWPVAGFPAILVFYVPAGEGIRVLRVLHGARDLAAALPGV